MFNMLFKVQIDQSQPHYFINKLLMHLKKVKRCAYNVEDDVTFNFDLG